MAIENRGEKCVNLLKQRDLPNLILELISMNLGDIEDERRRDKIIDQLLKVSDILKEKPVNVDCLLKEEDIKKLIEVLG